MSTVNVDAAFAKLKAKTTSIRLCTSGKTGNGKSYVGNALSNLCTGLNQIIFKEFMGPNSGTQTQQQHDFAHGGVNVSITDNPGFLDSSGNGRMNDQLQQLVRNNQNTTFHAVLHCLSMVGRLDQAEQACLQIAKQIFGLDVVKYFIFVLSHADGKSVQELQTAKDAWKNILATCLEVNPSTLLICCVSKDNPLLIVDVWNQIASLVEQRPEAFSPPQIPVVQVQAQGPTPPSDRVSFTHGVVVGGKRWW